MKFKNILLTTIVSGASMFTILPVSAQNLYFEGNIEEIIKNISDNVNQTNATKHEDINYEILRWEQRTFDLSNIFGWKFFIPIADLANTMQYDLHLEDNGNIFISTTDTNTVGKNTFHAAICEKRKHTNLITPKITEGRTVHIWMSTAD